MGVMLMELPSFHAEQVKLTTTKVMQNKEKNNVLLVLREAKLPLLHALMILRETRSSNGGRIYEQGTKRVVVGLIPLKLQPKRFSKKENLVKIKRNNLK